MGLQLRVRDGIRGRVVQVEQRGAERPVRVGTGADCEIRVGGAGAPVQCELFVHRGRWVVKHIPGAAAGTRLNRNLLSKAAYLNPDDRIYLGETEDAAVIEVGPVAASAASTAARPTTPESILELRSPVEDDGWLREDQDEQVVLEPGVSASPPAPRLASRRPRRSRSGVGWTVLLTLLIIGGGAIAIWKFRPPGEASPPAPLASQDASPVGTTMPATAPLRQKENIFDTGWQAPAAETSRTGTAGRQGASAVDPRKREEAWVELEKAVNGPSAARAVFLIEEYRAARPGVFEAELSAFLEDALDQIWWERVRALCGRRDALRAEIQRISDAIAEETDAEFREKLEAERSQKEELLRLELQTLTREMGYIDKAPPNVLDEGMMLHLRRQRDGELYAAWKGKVIRSISRTRGYLPWERAR